jgi:NAD(P)-dependent dehydrogenase (short-subunit alcohol dehydrogenase family)
MKTEQFASVIDANLTGSFIMSRLVLADMVKARTGRSLIWHLSPDSMAMLVKSTMLPQKLVLLV